MKRRIVVAVLAALATSGCNRGVGVAPPPTKGDQAYFLFSPTTAQQGWDAIASVRAGLLVKDAKRIRTAGIINAQRPDMYINADAACARDAAFVASVKRLARAKGIAKVTCSDTLPGAL